MGQDLKLSEKLLCLSVDPTKGGILFRASPTLGITLTGLVFAELINKGLISIDNEVIHLVNPALQKDEVHEFFLSPIRAREKDRKIRPWISWFSIRGSKIKKLLIRQLLKKYVLRMEEKRFLFIPYIKVYLMDRSLVESIRKEVESTMLGKTEPTRESIMLAIMAGKTNLLHRIFPDKVQRRQASLNLKKFPETDLSKAVHQAIQLMHATTVAASS